MGNRLPHGLGGRGHWLDMLGVGEGSMNAAQLLDDAVVRDGLADQVRETPPLGPQS
jgi:hypothetical protein